MHQSRPLKKPQWRQSHVVRRILWQIVDVFSSRHPHLFESFALLSLASPRMDFTNKNVSETQAGGSLYRGYCDCARAVIGRL